MKKAAAKPSNPATSGPLHLMLKLGENHLEVMGTENFVVRMRDWFMNAVEASKPERKERNITEDLNEEG